MALVEHIAGAKRLPTELVEQILLKTDGIPLFVEELAKAILELGILREGTDGYELIKPLTTLTIPETWPTPAAGPHRAPSLHQGVGADWRGDRPGVRLRAFLGPHQPERGGAEPRPSANC